MSPEEEPHLLPAVQVTPREGVAKVKDLRKSQKAVGLDLGLPKPPCTYTNQKDRCLSWPSGCPCHRLKEEGFEQGEQAHLRDEQHLSSVTCFYISGAP